MSEIQTNLHTIEFKSSGMYRFNSRVQKEGESMDQFVKALKLLTEGCEFDKLQSSLIRDRIIFGTNDHPIKERLLQEDDPTLEDTLKIARSLETPKHELNSMSSQPQVNVHKLMKKAPSSSSRPRFSSQKHRSRPKQFYVPQNTPKSSNIRKPQKCCPNCGNSPHPFSQCPARHQTCNYCRKLHHFKKMCRKLKYINQKTHKIEIGDEEEEEDYEEYTYETLKINSVETEDEAFATLGIQLPRHNSRNTKHKLKVKIDTGSQGNALPFRLYKEMFPQKFDSGGQPTELELDRSKAKITEYGGSQVKQYGTCKIKCSYKEKEENATFYVTEDKGPAILGLPTLRELGLVGTNLEMKLQDRSKNAANARSSPKSNPHKTPESPKASLMTQCPDNFNGIGKFQGKYHIHIDPTVPEVIHPQRKIPLKLKDKIKTELDEMETMGIIKRIKVEEPTAWVNSLVYREKPPGRLRLCLDPKDLNKAILREHHTTQTLEEILPHLSGAKYFSILDAKCGYWNVELDDSSYLTTFNSPFGRYRFLRMPFGLRMSQDVFQAKIDQTFEGCKGVIGIADDIVVFGKTTKEHDANLQNMILRCQETGLKLNPDKCRIKENHIKFYGIICTGEGIKPDPAKVEAIKAMISSRK
ncbi:uncharacterized protein LOC101852102 [Aplysia californica]|uniref:Uncharacterized protein LOC101852102 n=1 Tax=Aplysia californica TaxID=6500 RepID=A0ABM0JU91_APLCA|nr:uncharacterized protein LOC101852102 [Aplysia californica]